MSYSGFKNVTNFSSALGEAELLRASLPMPLPICGCCTAPVPGCHQRDTWAWWEEGAALVPTAVDFTPGPPLLPLGTTQHQRLVVPAGWPGEERSLHPASCILHPAPRGARVSPAVLHSPTSPSPQRDLGTTTCILVNALVKAGKSPHEMPTALSAQSPYRVSKTLLLPGSWKAPRPSRAGLFRPGGWDTAAGAAAQIWQQLCFGRNYKETLCPAAKKPDKNLRACEW